jgi:hypothetical protein
LRRYIAAKQAVASDYEGKMAELLEALHAMERDVVGPGR